MHTKGLVKPILLAVLSITGYTLATFALVKAVKSSKSMQDSFDECLYDYSNF